MSIPSKNGSRWTTFVIVSFLLCLVFSLTAMAQTTPADKVLDEKAVSALLDALKGGLPDLIDDEDTVDAIIEKWDAREDLVGKTHSYVLNSLFQDLKELVSDKETLDKVRADWRKKYGQTTVAQPQSKPTPVPNPTPAPVKSETAVFKIEDEGYSGTKLAIEGLWGEVGRTETTGAINTYQAIRHAPYSGVQLTPSIILGGDVKFFNWRFEPAGDGYYYIKTEVNFKKAAESAPAEMKDAFEKAGADMIDSIVAGDVADNNLYFQAAYGRDNAKWKLVPLGNNKFYIVDKKHGLAIVAGNNADGNLYHQAPAGRKNAIWNITLVRGNEDIPKEIKVN